MQSELTPEEEEELSSLLFRVYTDLPVSAEDYKRMLELERKTDVDSNAG